MKKKNKILYTSILLFTMFIFLILALRLIDVRAIGPSGSKIGLAPLNGAVHDALKTNSAAYTLSEILGYLTIASVLVFAYICVYQLIKRHSIKKVDSDIILFGAFCILLAIVYLFFEIFVVNYRPVLIDGKLEASFPSSHTMLAVSVAGAASYQIVNRVKNSILRIGGVALFIILSFATVLCRLLSGVHWVTDIIGGLLLSGALVMLYIWFCEKAKYVITDID